MTLTNRLLVFFLVTLALVLAGFSTALFLLARNELHHQLDERLEAAVNTLVAACEVGPEGVEWEPRERSLVFGTGVRGDQLAWLVTSHEGQPVDRSGDPAVDDLLTETAARLTEQNRSTKRVSWHGERWQVRQQCLVAPPPTAHTRLDEKRYPALAVTVGAPLEPMRSALWRLAGVLAALSSAMWLLALVSGRAVCRRALRPLTNMAEAARLMPAALAGRLPVSPARDELSDLGQAFNGLLDRVQESFERQRRFTGEASHQLRTPLTAMLGQVEVALRRDRTSEEYRRVLESVQLQADRLRHLVEALLFLARADEEARLPNLEQLDLVAWLPEYLKSWANHPRADDLQVLLGDGGPISIETHRLMFGELLNNLIDNAVKYSKQGTPVSIRLGTSPRFAWIEVIDKGCGIAAAEQPTLFRPFHRTATARQLGIPGLGLGLALVARLTNAFGGSIEVESEPGTGSRFRVYYPVKNSTN